MINTKYEFEHRSIYEIIKIYNIVTILSKCQYFLVEGGPQIARRNYDIDNIRSTKFSISINLWHKNISNFKLNIYQYLV